MSLLNKVAGLQSHACNFIKIKTASQVFSGKFYEFFKNAFFVEQLRVTTSVL